MSGKSCCCGCFSVRDGTQIIAVLCIISALPIFGQNFASMITFATADPKEIAAVLHDPADTDWSSRQEFQDLIRDYRCWISGFFALGCMFALVDLILSGLLLNGVRTSTASRCRPWLCYNFFALMIVVIVSTILSIILLTSGNVALGIGLLMSVITGTLIRGYFLNVVRQYIQELDRARLAGLSAPNQNQSYGTETVSPPPPYNNCVYSLKTTKEKEDPNGNELFTCSKLPPPGFPEGAVA